MLFESVWKIVADYQNCLYNDYGDSHRAPFTLSRFKSLLIHSGWEEKLNNSTDSTHIELHFLHRAITWSHFWVKDDGITITTMFNQNFQWMFKQTKITFLTLSLLRGARDVVLIALHNFCDFSVVITEWNFFSLLLCRVSKLVRGKSNYDDENDSIKFRLFWHYLLFCWARCCWCLLIFFFF